MLLDSTTPAAALLPAPPSTGINAFLIADVRGYTRFTETYGDEAAARLAARFAALTREGVQAHEGRVLELRGDEALCVFTSVRQALRAALALQARYATALRDESLGVGIGLDAGEAVALEGGFRGAALNLAARLCASAAAGEVLVSETLAHLAGTVPEMTLLTRGHLLLKGMAAPVRVLQVLPPRFVAVVAASPDAGAADPLIVDLRAHGIACWTTRVLLEGEEGAADVPSPLTARSPASPSAPMAACSRSGVARGSLPAVGVRSCSGNSLACSRWQTPSQETQTGQRASLSAHPATPSTRAARTGQSDNGTRGAPVPWGRRSSVPSTASMALRSVPMGGSWPPLARTGRCGSGTRATHKSQPCRKIAYPAFTWRGSPSVRTGSSWPREAPTARSTSGASRPPATFTPLARPSGDRQHGS